MTQIHTYLQALMLTDDKPLSFHPSELLFKDGQASDGRMYVVREGTIRLLRGGRLLETVEAGGIVGELALVDPAPRSASAVAGPQGCTVTSVNERAFHELVKLVPGIALEMMRVLARRLRKTTSEKSHRVLKGRPGRGKGRKARARKRNAS